VTTYDALGHRFTVDVEDHDVERFLRRVLAPLAADVPADAGYAIGPGPDGLVVRRADDRYEIAGGPVQVALSRFMTYVNTCGIEAVGHLVVLHASAVVVDGGALVVPAQPGSGKSTLCAALVAAGATYVTDEAVPVLPDGRILPYPKPIVVGSGSFGVLGAWRDAAAQSGGDDDDLWWLDPTTIGRGVAHEPVPIRWVVAPRYRPDQPIELEAISAAATTAAMASNCFNLPHHGRRGIEHLADVARRASGFELHHPGADVAAAHLLEVLR
jgi:hypothetical protein